MRHALAALPAVLSILPAQAGPARRVPEAPVDLNAAGVTELMQLPRVGARTAARIVAWRREHGPFRRREDLLAVRGIGEKAFLRLRPYLRVAGEAP